MIFKISFKYNNIMCISQNHANGNAGNHIFLLVPVKK